MVWSFFKHKSTSGRERRWRPAIEGLEQRLVPYSLSGLQWASPEISVSYMPDGTNADGYSSRLFAELDAIAPTATWQREFARALATWAEVANVNFHFVADDGSPKGTFGFVQGDSRFGDIRLTARSTSGLAISHFPNIGSFGSTEGGDITLNSDRTFAIGSHPDLYSVLLHESGHSLGLDHSTSGTVMYGALMGVYSGLTADDIAGMQAIYGARQADAYDAAAANNSFGSATTLYLDASGKLSTRADLTSRADVDYYRLTAPASFDGTLSLAVDARNLSLLAPKVSVYDAQGSLLATSVGAGFGTVATVSLTGLTPGQSYIVMADGATDDVFGVGAYQVQAQFGGVVQPPAPPPSPPSPPADRYEVNDVMASASDLGKISNATTTGLTVHTAADLDYYSFVPPKNGTYVVSIAFTHANGNLDLTVYNAAGNVLGSAASGRDNELLSLALSGGQRYYVKIHSPVGATNIYDLAIAKSTNGGGGRGRGAGLRDQPATQPDGWNFSFSLPGAVRTAGEATGLGPVRLVERLGIASQEPGLRAPAQAPGLATSLSQPGREKQESLADWPQAWLDDLGDLGVPLDQLERDLLPQLPLRERVAFTSWGRE